jgi:hypothetical protein
MYSVLLRNVSSIEQSGLFEEGFFRLLAYAISKIIFDIFAASLYLSLSLSRARARSHNLRHGGS